ncbi:LLM class flavin-dependent oxidoreductase [Streptomyces sp. RFCAC02]|uniref:LLM class flavin-dependent oxidoreductase n=1 Tax=Streptomyces sp. RFCAC02 TaxID=2499143 RepID=UPI001021D7FA|nr:LLM class flavin-dependent oxidoreductase [Streptomyces sp. RFCAC02]
MFDRDLHPEELAEFARVAERSGADDLWVVEDLEWAGAVSSAAVALAATDRLRLGIGITPAPLRNPTLLAMELATLARVFPGRLAAGIGHGVPEWMERVGAATPAKLALLGETITVVRALLHGERADLAGRAVTADGVRLVHPPAVPPPVVAGVVRPKSLELAGRVADGLILSEGQGPARIAAALALADRGRAAAPRPWGDDRLTVFAYLCVSDDPGEVARTVAPVVADTARWLGIPPDDVFMAAGDAATAAARVTELWEAGASTVVLRPLSTDAGAATAQARAVLTALGRPTA